MTGRALTKTGRGAVATGAAATGAASLGAVALGAVVLGALAVGALAIGRLSVGRARLRRVEIGELSVGRLDVRAVGAGGKLSALARVRAAPGRGDDLARLLREAAGAPGTLLYRAHRSGVDPDLFLFCESYADAAAFERHAAAPRLEALLRQAAGEGIVAASGDGALEVGLYRAL